MKLGIIFKSYKHTKNSPFNIYPFLLQARRTFIKKEIFPVSQVRKFYGIFKYDYLTDLFLNYSVSQITAHRIKLRKEYVRIYTTIFLTWHKEDIQFIDLDTGSSLDYNDVYDFRFNGSTLPDNQPNMTSFKRRGGRRIEL